MSSSVVTENASSDRLHTFVDGIKDVLSLPDIAQRVLNVVNDDESSAQDLHKVVESDPALVARLLRTANSSKFGLSVRIDSVQRAVAILGSNMIKNLALTISIAESFKGDVTIGTYSRKGLWKHLVTVAVASRLLAEQCGLPQSDEAYMSGLLHDLGFILLDQHNHELFVQLIENTEPNTPIVELEHQILGFDHTKLGAALAEKWGFPSVVVNSIRFHHNSPLCPREFRKIVGVVEVANFLCTESGISSIGRHHVARPSRSTLDDLSIRVVNLEKLLPDLDEELQKYDEVFDL